MLQRTVVASVLVAAALSAGCKKKNTDPGAGSGTGTSTVTPPPPPMRPSQNPQAKLPPLEVPADPQGAAKIALGNALFFDKRLSVDGSRSCYSCHLNEDGLGGHDPLAIGAAGKQLPRHSPVLWNVAYHRGAFYWDGRSPTLEAQAKAAWAGGNLGVGEDKLAAKTAELLKIPGYKKMFTEAFGDVAITADQVTQALAAYERTILCNDTPYDRYAAGNKTALTDGQQRGLDVLLGKGGCIACHTPPHFTSAMQTEGGTYWNAGVGIVGKDPAAVDIGRKKVSNKDEDYAAFKVPSLRGVGKSPPYFHDGSMAKLEDVVHYMASGATPGATNLSALLVTPKGLTPAEEADLVDFLRGGLDCPGGLTEPKLP